MYHLPLCKVGTPCGQRERLSVSKQLYRSHRVFGYEVARTKTEDGTELVVLQTAPHKQEVSPAHMLMPVSPKEAAFEATIRLSDAIEHARFLGLSLDALRAAFEDAIQPDETSAAS